MEIETKIFEVKAVRKGLKKNDVKLGKTCELVDFLFDISGFHLEGVTFFQGAGDKSGKIQKDSVVLEVLSAKELGELFEEISSRKNFTGCKFRLRVLDGIPFMTFKGPKTEKRGIKSREEIEFRIGNLHDGMAWLIACGATLVEVVTRSREVYYLKKFTTEIVIDQVLSPHTDLEYAEIEAPDYETLYKVMKKYFGLGEEDVSSAGIKKIRQKKVEKTISKSIKKLGKRFSNR